MGTAGGPTVTATDWDVTTCDGFLACYDATFREVYAAAARLCGGERARAEDLTQDVYLHLLRAARSGTLSRIGIGWLRTAMRHRFLDSVRARGREERRLRLVAGPDVTDADDDDDGLPLLDGLGDRERAALVWRHVDGLSTAEVAGLLGSSVRATESLLARARQRARRTHVGRGTSHG